MICEDLNSFNYDNIVINDPIKNSVIQYNYFYKLLYSTNITIYSSIFIIFELNNITIENEKILFNNDVINKNIFDKLIQLEEYLLNLINEPKVKIYKFKEFYENKYLKYTVGDDVDKFNNYKYANDSDFKNKKLILKISGIWESKDNIGLTFKIIGVNKCISFT